MSTVPLGKGEGASKSLRAQLSELRHDIFLSVARAHGFKCAEDVPATALHGLEQEGEQLREQYSQQIKKDDSRAGRNVFSPEFEGLLRDHQRLCDLIANPET